MKINAKYIDGIIGTILVNNDYRKTNSVVDCIIIQKCSSKTNADESKLYDYDHYRPFVIKARKTSDKPGFLKDAYVPTEKNISDIIRQIEETIKSNPEEKYLISVVSQFYEEADNKDKFFHIERYDATYVDISNLEEKKDEISKVLFSYVKNKK